MPSLKMLSWQQLRIYSRRHKEICGGHLGSVEVAGSSRHGCGQCSVVPVSQLVVGARMYLLLNHILRIVEQEDYRIGSYANGSGYLLRTQSNVLSGEGAITQYIQRPCAIPIQSPSLYAVMQQNCIVSATVKVKNITSTMKQSSPGLQSGSSRLQQSRAAAFPSAERPQRTRAMHPPTIQLTRIASAPRT